MSGEPATATLSLTDEERATAGAERSAYFFLVLESHRPLAPPLRLALAGLEAVAVGRGASRRIEGAQSRRLGLQIEDPWMSTAHARVVKLLGQWVLEDTGSKNGAWVNGARVPRATLADGDVVEIGRTFFLYRSSLPMFPGDPPILDAAAQGSVAPGLATLLPELARAYAALARIARSPVSVMIEGETGTGKEVMARAIHALSARRGAFVAVDCGALPEALVEGELFGYKQGAFSGAKQDQPGLVRSADGGTLLLDEIGDLKLSAQAAFLRVLQEREVRPLGATRPFPVDIRVLTATHRPLEKLVAEGKFRADLFARLSGHKLEPWPLRGRREDLGLILGALLGRLAADAPERVTLHPRAARALLRYAFPGNVRELEKALGAAIVLAQGEPVDVEHLPAAVQRSGAVSSEAATPGEPEDDARRAELVALLGEHRGNVTRVATAMGKARMQVQRWLKRYGLNPEDYRR